MFLNLYLVLDLFSRYPVAWMVAERENSALSKQLFAEAITRYELEPSSITVHNDRGAPMTALGFVDMLAQLGVERSKSRPRVSNDNPFSESCFKTIKYQPDYPGRFRDVAHARRWFIGFFDWYANSHRHSGLALFTPADVFFGRVAELADNRQRALDAAYEAHAERFVRGRPTVRLPLGKVAINPIDPGAATQSVADALTDLTARHRAPPARDHSRRQRPCCRAPARHHISIPRWAHRFRFIRGSHPLTRSGTASLARPAPMKPARCRPQKQKRRKAPPLGRPMHLHNAEVAMRAIIFLATLVGALLGAEGSARAYLEVCNGSTNAISWSHAINDTSCPKCYWSHCPPNPYLRMQGWFYIPPGECRRVFAGDARRAWYYFVVDPNDERLVGSGYKHDLTVVPIGNHEGCAALVTASASQVYPARHAKFQTLDADTRIVIQ